MYHKDINDEAILAKAKKVLGSVDHPEYEDTWREVCIDGEFFDCNIFSRKNVLDQEDNDEPDVVADVYPTVIIEGSTNDFGDPYRDTDTSCLVGRFYPEVKE
jgi:hypothetical protein